MIIGKPTDAPVAESLDEFRIVLVARGDEVTVAAEGAGVEVPPVPFSAPFTPDDIARALSDDSPTRLTTDPLSAVGATLFHAVFAEQIGRAFWARAAEGERRHRGLRLRVVTNVERLQHLPWELLFDPSRGDFMSLSGRLTLVRRRPDGYRGPGPNDDDVLAPLPRLRVLAAEADVTGMMRTGDDLARLRALAEAHPSRIALTELRAATPEALASELRPGAFDVFHFAGTGTVVSAESKRGGVEQELRFMGGQPGTGTPLKRSVLTDMLRRAGVRLAVLNACHSDWVARSMARVLPAAVGFRDMVRVESCLAFVDAFYRAVLGGHPVDLAVTAARQALDRAQPGLGDWGKVICYLQATDGAFLLGPPAGGESSPSGVPASASAEDGAAGSREAARLLRLRNIYTRNLAALEELATTGAAPPDEGYRTQTAELREKLDEVGRQLREVDGVR